MISKLDLDTDKWLYHPVVDLNVGGFTFTTRVSTLQRCPKSMLATMFSGRHRLDLDRKGRYFIDRDGRYFGYILNYLRDPESFNVPVECCEQLLDEAKYYQIEELVSLLEEHPSMLSSSIVHTFRTSLGDKYQCLKRQVIEVATRKNLVPSQTQYNFTEFVPVINFSSNSILGSISQETVINSAPTVPPVLGRPPQPGLKTDIRIATPSVVFDPVEILTNAHTTTPGVTSLNVNNASANLSVGSNLRRNHQRPYNSCLSDGHEFMDIDIVSSYWHKSDIWYLLIRDLKRELNTHVEMKMEQSTPVFCKRCRFQNSYGVCIFSIYWLETLALHGSTCLTTQHTSYTQSTTYRKNYHTENLL